MKLGHQCKDHEGRAGWLVSIVSRGLLSDCKNSQNLLEGLFEALVPSSDTDAVLSAPIVLYDSPSRPRITMEAVLSLYGQKSEHLN